MRTDSPGSSDSAAAIVAISAPTKAKITITIPDRIATPPLGVKPPSAVSWPTPPPRDHVDRAAITMKATIAATLIDANQNSNSPKARTETRFVAVSSEHQHERGGPDRHARQPFLDDRRARRGLDREHDDPEVPVQPADERSAPSRRARSPRSRRTSRCSDARPPSRPASASRAPRAGLRQDRRAPRPGPVWLITAPEPTNNPAPITPPSEIIVTWRRLRPLWSPPLSSTMLTAYPRIAVIHHLQQPFLGHAADAAGRGRGALRRRCPTSTASTGSSPSAASSPRGTRRSTPEVELIREAVRARSRSSASASARSCWRCAHGGEIVAPAAPARDLGAARTSIADDPVLGAIPPARTRLHWNEDGFEPPPGAVEILRTATRRPRGGLPHRPPRVGRPVPSGGRPAPRSTAGTRSGATCSSPPA